MLMPLRVLVLLSLLLLSTLQLSLEEYGELEKTEPQLLFEELELPEVENFPRIQKLIFLTPWNQKGHELSLKYASKLDYVSPCWYSLQTNSRGEPIFENIHNYDKTFARELRWANPSVKLVPRIYVDGSQTAFFKSIGNSRVHFEAALTLIEKLIVSHSFDGIVWDSPYNFFQLSRGSLNSLIVDLLEGLRIRLPQRLLLFNMASPGDHMNSLDTENYRRLPVDYLLVQNYDKGGHFLQTIEKAIKWKQSLGSSAKLMLLLPFFSLTGTSQPLATRQVAQLLQKEGFRSGRMSQGMCLVSTGSRQHFYVPCFGYFKEAFRLAEVASASVGFWEGGNGLENYFKFM